MKTKTLLLFVAVFCFRSLFAADVVLNDFETGSPTVTPLYGAAFSIVANPNTTGNSSAFCGQISRTSTNWWEMVSFSTSFTVLPNTSQYVHILINYPVQPALTISLNISGQIAQSNAYTKIGQWQDIVFEIQGGTDGVTVNSLGIFDDLSSALVTGTYGYMDNVILNNDPFPQGASFLTGNNLYDFEPGTANNITGIQTYSSTNDIITYPVANPYISGINSTTNCLKRTAVDPSSWWSGFDFTFVNPVLVDANHKYLHVMVSAPANGQVVMFDVRTESTAIIATQQNTITTANTWQDIVLDVSGLKYISGMRAYLGFWNGTTAGDYYLDEIYLDGNSAPRTTVVISLINNNPTMGSISGDGTFTQGINTTVTASPNSGYRFVNWTEDGLQVSTSNTYSFVAANRTLTANFASNSLNLSENTNASTLINCSTCDVSVSNNSTLTIDNDQTLNSVTIESGSKLDVSTNTLTVSDLILKAGKTTAPSVSVTNAMVVSGTVKLLKTVDNTQWYFLSLPSDVAVDNITQVSGTGTLGTLGTNWWIKYYDGASRAVNLGLSSNWKQISTGQTLTANQGYIIGLDNTLTGDYVLSFPLNTNLVTSAETQKTVTVGTYGEGTSTPDNSVGWNLVGIPYLSKFTGSGVGANYLTFYNGTTYSQLTNTEVTSINPFDAFFIQASAAGTTTNLSYTLASRQLVRSMVDTDASDRVQLNITNGSGTDKTNIIMDDTQSTAYQINQDLEKWLTTGTDIPQVYTILNGVNYAYNALPMNSVSNLHVGIYTKIAGETTIHADATKAPSLSSLLLTDNTTGTTTDLLTSDYSFTSAAGTDISRFVITAQRVTTNNNLIKGESDIPKISIINSKLLIDNISGLTTIRVFDTLGRTILNQSFNNNSIVIPLSTKGIYIVKVESVLKSWTNKIINQ